MTFLQILMLLAGVMLGEADVLDVDAAKAVGYVVINRVASADFPNTYAAVIEQGFYGWSEPTNEYIHLAYELFVEPDSTNGCLFVISEQDKQYLGFPPGDIVYGSGKYQLHLYKKWYEGRNFLKKERE